MTITKCDVCRKEIPKEDAHVSLALIGGPRYFVAATICLSCGRPLTAFFTKHRLDAERSYRRTPAPRQPKTKRAA
jgi:hypothetical protein